VLSNDTSTSSASPPRSTVKQRRGDAPGDVHAADGVSESGDPLRQRAAEFGGRQRVTDARSCPEGGAVESADLALRSLVAVCAAARIR